MENYIIHILFLNTHSAYVSLYSGLFSYLRPLMSLMHIAYYTLWTKMVLYSTKSGSLACNHIGNHLSLSDVAM